MELMSSRSRARAAISSSSSATRPFEEHAGVPARAQAPLPHLDQLADLLEAQPEPLGPLDEPDQVGRVVVVQPVARRAAVGGGQQPDALVVAQRVG